MHPDTRQVFSGSSHTTVTDFKQLTQEIHRTLDWDANRPLQFHLQVARGYRTEGLRHVEAGDFAKAFVNLSKAAILFLEKVPKHQGFSRLSATLRDEIRLNGVTLLEQLGNIKPILVRQCETQKGVYSQELISVGRSAGSEARGETDRLFQPRNVPKLEDTESQFTVEERVEVEKDEMEREGENGMLCRYDNAQIPDDIYQAGSRQEDQTEALYPQLSIFPSKINRNPQPVLPTVLANLPATAARVSVASLQHDVPIIQSPNYDRALKVAWAHEVITLVLSTFGVSTWLDLAVEEVVVADLDFRHLAELATSIIFDVAASVPETKALPPHVAEAVYLRAVLASTGAFPDQIKHDPSAAVNGFSRAARAGYSLAFYELGRYYEKQNEITSARAYFERGVQHGAQKCIYRMGMAYLFGQLGLLVDQGYAVQLLHRAAALATASAPVAAYSFALLLFGKLHSTPAIPVAVLEPFISVGSTPLIEAQNYLERAAYLGYAPAQYRLGLMYECALAPTTFNPTLSLQYYYLASQHSYPKAHMALALWFLHGCDGVFGRDEELAYMFTEKAALEGLPTAELFMGLYNEAGMRCARSIPNAVWWYERAEAHSDSAIGRKAAERLNLLSGHSAPQDTGAFQQDAAAEFTVTELSQLPLQTALTFEEKAHGRSETFAASLNAGRRSDECGLDNTPKKPLGRLKGVVTKLDDIFNDLQKYKQLLLLRSSSAQVLLDMFQILLDSLGLGSVFRRNLLVATQRLSTRSGLYPALLNLEGVESTSENFVAAGGFSDVYKGFFLGRTVCLKVIRLRQTSQTETFFKQFSSEAILWAQLAHPNLLPIYGVCYYNKRLCLVSPWMDNGDINEFLREHPDVNRMLLVLDVAAGVSYLHEHGIVHGDLKGANILVDSSGRACVGDFGLSAVSDSDILHWTSHSSAASRGGSVRWQAPELFDEETDEVVHNSKPTDVYAFGSVAYEVLTGKIPFFEHKLDATVIFQVKSGAKPSRPLPSSLAWGAWGLTEAFWSLMEASWSANPSDRPTIHQILTRCNAHVSEDDRPIKDAGDVSSARFRDFMGARSKLPNVDEIEALLDNIH